MKRIEVEPTRRIVLGAGLGVGVGVGLAACSSGTTEDSAPVEESTAGAIEDFTADQTFTATEPLEFSMLWTDWPDFPITD